MKVDLVLKNCRLVSPWGITEAGVAVENGEIAAIAREPHLPQADQAIDLKGKPVLPGVLDGHCHATSIPDTPKTATG